jgi:hypothetical protein
MAFSVCHGTSHGGWLRAVINLKNLTLGWISGAIRCGRRQTTRFLGANTFFEGSDHERMNRFMAWYSKKIQPQADSIMEQESSENRVALSLRAYISLCRNCMNRSYDCWGDGLRVVPTARSKLHNSRRNQNFGGYGYG